MRQILYPLMPNAVTVTSQNLSAAGPCAQATQAQAIEGWTAPWAGVPWGAGRACHAGSGRHASLPGRPPAWAWPWFRPAHRSPACAGLLFAAGSTTPTPRLPASRQRTRGCGRVRLRPPSHSPASRVCSPGRAQPPTPAPPCALAPCSVTGPPAARMAGPPSRAPRHPCPWRYRFGVVRLRGLCAPSAAEVAAAAITVPVSAVTDPRAPDGRRRPAGRPRRARMPLCSCLWLLHQAEAHHAVRIRHVDPRGHRRVHLLQRVPGAEGP